MEKSDVIAVMHEAMVLALKVAAPLLIASILIGLIIAIFQAATQIHEQTLTFVPKLIIIAIVFLALGSWMLTELDDFFKSIFDWITKV